MPGNSSGGLAPGNAADGSNASASKGLYSTVEHILVGEDGRPSFMRQEFLNADGFLQMSGNNEACDPFRRYSGDSGYDAGIGVQLV